MEVKLFEYGGPSITPEQLNPVVQRVFQACLNNSSCEVVGLKSDPDKKTQTIVADFADGTFDAENSAGINRVERLSITYNPESDFFWEVKALRKDFPITLHQYHVMENEPCSLCLYFEPWYTIERSWTPELFLNRIFWWLRETANGTIHGDDQPLEQLFFSSPYNIILPDNYFNEEVTKQKSISFTLIENDAAKAKTLIGEYAINSSDNKPFCVIVPVALTPLENGPVEDYPYTLGQLQALLENRGAGILESLKNSVLDKVTGNGISNDSRGKEFVLLLIGVPRIRNGVIEKIESQGFMVDLSFVELGEKLNILIKAPDQNRWYRDALGNSEGDGWENVPVFPVSVSTYPSREDIRQFSGIDKDEVGPSGIIAGAGALGGMIGKIWERECWGNWIFIDDDVVKPHNIARHIATRHAVGFAKSVVLDSTVTGIHGFKDNNSPKNYVDSVTSDNPEIVKLIEDSEILIDATTTLYVPRDISRQEKYPRTASVFIAPSGMSSVMLLEDIDRSIRCNSLEAQYYRAILNSEWGKDHLSGHLGKFWVGAGCREATVAISDELIHLHAAILSRQIRKRSEDSSARICVWDCEDQTGGVTFYDIAVYSTQSALVSDWEILWDEGFIDEAKIHRKTALPNETGGLLFGIIDQKDKTITLVKACEAPENSESSPSSFERGAYESPDVLDDCHKRTGGVVTYVGEWHSHPQGCSVLPSQDDIGQLHFLTNALQIEGMPALMLIISDSSIGFYLRGQGVMLECAKAS